mgnify:CR=1 FL=1
MRCCLFLRLTLTHLLQLQTIVSLSTDDHLLQTVSELRLKLQALVANARGMNVNNRRRAVHPRPVLLPAEVERLLQPFHHRLVRWVNQRVVEQLELGQVREETQRVREDLQEVISEHELSEIHALGDEVGKPVDVITGHLELRRAKRDSAHF